MADNGAIFGEKSDIDRLIETLEEFMDEMNPDRSASNKIKQTIPPKPKYQDLNRMVGDLGIAVPTGFWLLHNDLIDINKSLSTTSGGGAPSNLTWEDVANNLVNKLPAMTGIIAGAVIVNNLVKDGNIDALKQIMELIPTVAADFITKVGGSLIGLIREGGLVFADVYDYFTNPETVEKRRKLNATYLSLSYSQLYEGLGYDVEIDSNGEIVGFKKKSWNKSDTYDVAGLGMNLLSGLLGGSSGFLGKVGKAAGNNVLAKTFNLEQWVDSISGMINEHLRGLVATGLDVYDMFTDPVVDEARRTFLRLYLSANYASLINGMGIGVEFNDDGSFKLVNSTGDKLLATAESLMSKIWAGVESGGITVMVEAGAEIAESAITGLAASIRSVGDLFSLGEENAKEVKKFAGLYMEAYYAKLINGMGFDVDFENVRLQHMSTGWEIYNELVGGFLSTASQNLVTGVGGVITGLVAIIKSIKDLATLPEPTKSEVKKYAGLYMESYYASLIYSMGYEIDFENARLKGVREDLPEDFKNDVRGVIKNKLTERAADKAASKNLFDTDMGEEEEALLKPIHQKYAPMFMEAYWISLIEAMGFDVNEDGSVKSTVEGRTAHRGFFGSIGDALFGDSTSDIIEEMADVFQDHMEGIFDDVTIDNATYVNPYVGAFFEAYFNNLVNDIDKNPGTWGLSGSSSKGKKALEEAILTAVGKSFSAEGIKTAVEINSTDYTEILRTMNTSLDTMKMRISEIFDSIGFDIQTDIKTIADNSANAVAVQADDYSFTYANSEPN